MTTCPPRSYHAKDWRFFLLHRASTGCAFAAATAFAPLGLDYLRLSLMAGHDRGFIALHLIGEYDLWLFLPCHHVAQLSSDMHRSH